MAIYSLKQNEEQAEHAAKYSNTAEHQLHKTRTTQTSGAIASLASIVSSVVLAVQPFGQSKTWPILLSVANAGGIYLSQRHVSDFWRHKAKIPFFTDYNDGITASNSMLQLLLILSGSWGVSAVLYLWPGLAN
ncbi:hypothetical protein LTR10_013253 [Elasticomyces elasticus]|uniref:Uncharacterized protein n=1 Tax=Exophiala sideris TaxID=1016849 RepID=A0A0D1YRK4_9EURO|nr:hypothetical protein LTR10_013253 [Elasticomyces elasticus]KAK5027518.1 hypothetical protein LTS07_007120 [Exophiala sideris]KAK5181023.1 hypothetical protein LTR44_006354 [Eurotiomycetes sp. CCFEE 6388]KAK5034777.1 hypothetical protein LTR13_005959 [Exophiala sideris]KAK5056485.1 hypothetical protein LTR69_008026 [Exophiala sideris]